MKMKKGDGGWEEIRIARVPSMQMDPRDLCDIYSALDAHWLIGLFDVERRTLPSAPSLAWSVLQKLLQTY